MTDAEEHTSAASTAPAQALRSVARPKQARSEQTLNRLLDAAETLIVERGVGALSIPEIVQAAGSSVGGFYARFKGKDELLRALEERFVGRLEAELMAVTEPSVWADKPAREIVDGFVRALVASYRKNRNLIQAFVLSAAADHEMWREGRRLRQRMSLQVATLLGGRASEIAHPNPAVALDTALFMVLGVLQQMVIFGEIRAGGSVLDDDQIRAELVRGVTAYLGIDAVAVT